MTRKNKYCINCFKILPIEEKTCQFCQFGQDDEDSPLYLSPPFRLNEQYYIGRVLGQGGFAITYLAYDRNLSQTVAIKEYFPIEFATRDANGMSVRSFGGQAEEQFYAGKDKFISEAKLLANFRSPHIVKIRQFFQAYNTAYFVMEYLQGQTLTEYIKSQGGKLSYTKVKKMLFPLLDALEEVHQKQVYHRDIKPDNIYITQSGEPILLDFGAARQSFKGKTSHLLSFLTPGFAPAEQYSSNGIQGPWTDIYSLSATMYFALTGVLPPVPPDRMFGEDELRPPSELGADISTAEEQWIMKGLAVRWSQRPDSIQAWRKFIEPSAKAIEVDAEALRAKAEENFINIAILPKLREKKLYPKVEEEIYSSAAFMEIPMRRVEDLIEKALNTTGSVRCQQDEADLKAQELQKREEELRRKEEELKHFEELRQKEEEMWWEAELAQQDARRLQQEEEDARQKAAAEVQARQNEELQQREAELKRKEEELRYFEELRQKEEELWRNAEQARLEAGQRQLEIDQLFKQQQLEAESQKQAELLKQKEAELKQKEEELLRQKAELLRQKEEELKQKEAAILAAQVPPAQATSRQAEVPVEELDEDISDEDVSELLKLFESPKKKQNAAATPKSTPPSAAPAEPEILRSVPRPELDKHYAALAASAAAMPVSKHPLIPSGSFQFPERITNTLGMEFALIQPTITGENFQLFKDYAVGPPELGFPILSTIPFYLQITPVTQMQWQMLMNINPSQFEADGVLPVDSVSWDDCQLFIKRLNQFQEALYRLPTEVEWEFACRAGGTGAYYFGDNPKDLEQYAWYQANARQSLHPVGLKRPNRFGLFDMLGNVKEWVLDRYLPLTPREAPPEKPTRTLRNGGWDASAEDCIWKSRSEAAPDLRAANVGFRLAIEIQF